MGRMATRPDLSNLPPAGSIAIEDGILALVRHAIATAPSHIRERLVRSFEALHTSNHMTGEQVAVFLAQLVSDLAYAARDPEQTTQRPIATYVDPRLLGKPMGSA
jgi:hypothetical protein